MEPVTRDFEVPMQCLSPVTIPNLTSGNAFNAPWEPLRWLGRLPVAYFKSEGFTKIAIIATTDTSGKLNVNWVQESADDLGVQVVAVEYFGVHDVDVIPQMAKNREANPQAIYIAASGSPAMTVLKAVKQLGIKMPVYPGSANATYAAARLVGDVQNAVTGGAKIHIWKELPNTDPQKEIIRSFVEAYENKFGEMADMYAAIGFDALNILAKAISAIGMDCKKIVKYLETNLGTYYGVSTTYKNMVDHRGTSESPGIIVRYDNGSFKLVRIMEQY
jgi:branched-chain amino acid transport system substrate-binding protein